MAIEVRIPESIGRYAEIPIGDLISDAQDRDPSDFKGSEFKALVDNIKARGIICPITATADGDGKLRVVAGKRRVAAAKILKLKMVPVFVRPTGDSLDVISANLFFKEPPPTLRARILQSLLDEKVYKTQSEIGRAMGMSQASISNMLSVLDLPKNVQEELDAGKLTGQMARHAKRTGKSDTDSIRDDLRGKRYYHLPKDSLIPKEGGDPVPMKIDVGATSVRVTVIVPLGEVQDGFAKALAREVHRVGEKDLAAAIKGFHKIQFHGGKG